MTEIRVSHFTQERRCRRLEVMRSARSVIDRTPRQLTSSQLHSLRILGREVSYLLELRRVSYALARALEAASQGRGGSLAGRVKQRPT